MKAQRPSTVSRLLALICSDYPVDISHTLVAAVGKREVDLVGFEAFSAAVRACLQYEAASHRSEEGPQVRRRPAPLRSSAVPSAATGALFA